MRRTQVYLEPELLAALDAFARQRGQSRAAALREAARRLLADAEAPNEDPLLGIVGLGNAGPGSVSVEHDRALIDEALALAGAWHDLDWDEAIRELDRIRHPADWERNA